MMMQTCSGCLAPFNSPTRDESDVCEQCEGQLARADLHALDNVQIEIPDELRNPRMRPTPNHLEHLYWPCNWRITGLRDKDRAFAQDVASSHDRARLLLSQLAAKGS